MKSPEDAKNPDEIDLNESDSGEEEETVAGVDDLFYVDKKPQRSKLSMPEPRQTDITDQPTNQSDDRSCLKNAEESTVGEKKADESSLQDEPIVKKLKRRNQDIYTNEEDS